MLIDKYRQESKLKSEQLNSKFYTLSAAAYDVCVDLGENEARFHQYLNYAIEGYREYHLDNAHTFEVLEIKMNDAKQIRVPSNFVDWVVVGFKCGDFIKVLTQDNMIPRTFEQDENHENIMNKPCEDINDVYVTDQLIPFGLDYNQEGWSNKYFGWAVHRNYLGYFDYDKRNRVINFKETVEKETTVYLEYLSDGINYNGSTLISPDAYKLIKLYIKWMRKENSDRAPLYEKRRAQDLYAQEESKVQLRNLDMTIDDAREALRNAYTLVPRN